MRAQILASIVALAHVANAKVDQDLKLTDEELLAFTGEDKSKPIYLAINGEIYDVSAKPSFYGPGGSYGHFAGRDASRAWVTECWDSEDQLTWRMDGLEEMFLPKWMDEELQRAVDGEDLGLDLGGVDLKSMLPALEARLNSIGRVTPEEQAERRKEDAIEAKAALNEKLQHWVGFFAGNDKYPRVGSVVREEGSGVAPPPICKEAMKKRPVRGGKLDALMGQAAAAGNKAAKAATEKVKEKVGEMPEHVKQMIAKKKAEAAGKDEL